MAHVHGRPGNEQEHLDSLLGRGKGDPDVHGYPGEAGTYQADSDPTRKIAGLKALQQNQKNIISAPTNQTSTTIPKQNYTGRRNKQ